MKSFSAYNRCMGLSFIFLKVFTVLCRNVKKLLFIYFIFNLIHPLGAKAFFPYFLCQLLEALLFQHL